MSAPLLDAFLPNAFSVVPNAYIEQTINVTPMHTLEMNAY
jgi:hypothetical protein